MKFVTIVGARPQFIKAKILNNIFESRHEEVIIHTGQHYDQNMSDVFFNELDIKEPKYNLQIGSSSHGKQTGKMIERIEEILLYEKPDCVIVYGDTNSTLAGAIATSKLNIPLCHIEAGLRSYNRKMPEEINRVLTDHVSSILFCPTQTSVENLKNEGIIKNVFNTGDIMNDAVKHYKYFAKNKYMNNKWKEILFTLKHDERIHLLKEKEFYLATIHRAENTDNTEKLYTIFGTLNKLDKIVLVSLHPRTKTMIKFDLSKLVNIIVIEPVGYLLMLYLQMISSMLITDSGGMQKEAYFLNIPCTTLRDETEWIETLENGRNVLTNITEETILMNVNRKYYAQKINKSPFGNGNSGIKMMTLLEKILERSDDK